MRTIGNVRQLMSSEVIFSLQSSIADVADEPALDCMLNDVLLHQITLGKRHLTLGTAVEDRAIEGGFLANLTGLKAN
jgi:hypothetical protein